MVILLRPAYRRDPDRVGQDGSTVTRLGDIIRDGHPTGLFIVTLVLRDPGECRIDGCRMAPVEGLEDLDARLAERP